MKKIVNVIYEAGAGGEFLSFALSQTPRFNTLKAKYDHSINKWDLSDNFNYDFLKQDNSLISIHRIHPPWENEEVEDCSELIKHYADYDAVWIVLYPTSTLGAKFCDDMKQIKLANANEIFQPTLVRTKAELEQMFPGLHVEQIFFADPYELWYSKKYKKLFEWIGNKFDIFMDIQNMINLRDLWLKLNVDISQKRV
tara:strand:+ start:200 stop:790 length:591 start_codon:yes stop_codon:yes gene_type:complete